MAGTDNLKPWKPGQSGNPRGTSRKVRTQRLLREFVAEGLQAQIPKEVAEKLGEHLEGLKVGQALAGDLLLRALAGNPHDLDRIISMEPRALAITADVTETKVQSPVYVPQSSDEDALVESARSEGHLH